ncbi:hypothetical protein [Paenibacillus sp. LHD-38]|nr:hypothetical protein [Paenibacillus sp. LHD-38]MDQ8739255.1 hypothetical protein [Paenibacillus sp. LHD-38]
MFLRFEGRENYRVPVTPYSGCYFDSIDWALCFGIMGGSHSPLMKVY